ncbi:MAG: magnesium/cobalt transporter CorA [Candidatus Binatia bacterium]
MGMVVGCAAYVDGRRIADLTLDELPDALRREGQFVWLGVLEPDEALLRRLQGIFQLHDLAVEDAFRAHQRPKLEEYGNGLFVVLRTVRSDHEGLHLGETHLFVGERYLLSIRHGASSSYAEVRTRCEATPGLLAKGPGFPLYAIMDFVVDHFFPVVQGLEEEIGSMEEALFTDTLRRETTRKIYALRRELVSLKRAVVPLIEVCNRLLRHDVGFIHPDVRPYFRDVYDHVVRVNEAADTMRELLTSALEANLSLVSVRQNEIMKRLAGWAAIFAVPTLIAGIYGMNFENVPEYHWRYGYALAWATMIGGAAALYVGFRRWRWL